MLRECCARVLDFGPEVSQTIIARVYDNVVSKALRANLSEPWSKNIPPPEYSLRFCTVLHEARRVKMFTPQARKLDAARPRKHFSMSRLAHPAPWCPARDRAEHYPRTLCNGFWGHLSDFFVGNQKTKPDARDPSNSKYCTVKYCSTVEDGVVQL